MNLLLPHTKEISVKKPEQIRQRWRNFIDALLRLFLSEEKTKKVWRFFSRYNPWRIGGILAGSIILTIGMQPSVKAQLFKDAEKEVDTVFKPFLDGQTDFLGALFGAGRLLFFAFAIGLIIVGIFDGITNRGSNWHIWVGIGSSLIIGYVLVSAIEGMVFG